MSLLNLTLCLISLIITYFLIVTLKKYKAKLKKYEERIQAIKSIDNTFLRNVLLNDTIGVWESHGPTNHSFNNEERKIYFSFGKTRLTGYKFFHTQPPIFVSLDLTETEAIEFFLTKTPNTYYDAQEKLSKFKIRMK